MSDRQTTTRRTAERGADESDGSRGFARPWIGQNVRRRPRDRDVPVNVRRLAVAVLCACLLTVPVLPASGTSDFVPAEPDDRSAVENRTTPGGALSETLVTHEARVAGSLQASVVEVDLTTSPSDRARAHRLAAFEGTLAEQLGWLQERVRTDTGADNGSLVDRPTDADVVRTRARALALRDLAERANQTVASLPENSTRSAGVDDGDFEAVARSSQAIAENGSDGPDDRDGERDDGRDDRYDRHSPFLIDDPDRDGFAYEHDGGAPWHDGARADDWRTNWSDAPSTDGDWSWVDSWQSGFWRGDGGDSDAEGWNWASHDWNGTGHDEDSWAWTSHEDAWNGTDHDENGWNGTGHDEDGWTWTSHDEDGWNSTGHHEATPSEHDTDADVADGDHYGWNGSYTDGADRSQFGDESEPAESAPEQDDEDGFPTQEGWSDDGDAAEPSSDTTEPWPDAERDDGSSPYFDDDTDDADEGDGGDGGDEFHDGTTDDGPDGDANDGGIDDGAADEEQTDDGDADEPWYHGGGDHDGPSDDGAYSYGGETADDGDWMGGWGAGD